MNIWGLFCTTTDWTQDLKHASLALFHLAVSPVSFSKFLIVLYAPLSCEMKYLSDEMMCKVYDIGNLIVLSYW